MVKIKYLLIPLMLALIVFFGSNGVHAIVLQDGVFIGGFYQHQQMTDFYSLYPEVRFHEGLDDVYQDGGKYYFTGDLFDLVQYRELYYGDFTPVLSLQYYEFVDKWTFANAGVQYNIPLGSLMLLDVNAIIFTYEGNYFKTIYINELDNAGMVYERYYGYDPDYYIGYDEGYGIGYNDGLSYGHFLHRDDYTKGFNAGESAGYLNGYDVGFVDGFESTSDGGMWGVLWSAILAPFTILNTEMLPGITLAMIVAVPLVFGLLGWILSTGKSRK